MKQLIILVMVLYGPLACSTENTKCTYPAGIIKQGPPSNLSSITSYTWDAGQDIRSDEHLRTLRILFKNGDHAVIQHKYCNMYNIEVIYFRNSQASYLDEATISKTVAGLFEQYSVIKVKFSTPLTDIISSSLKKNHFDTDKDISIGLPESKATYKTSRVEYSINYKPLDEFNSLYSSAVKFYVGVGGES